MQRIYRTASAMAVVVAALSACGGGGSAAPAADPPPLTVTLDTRDVTLGATPNDADQERALNVRFGGTVPDKLYVSVQSSYQGVALANISGTSVADLQIALRFRSAGALPNGVYVDTVGVVVCTDAQCQSPVPGSPFNVSTTYTVNGSTMTGVPPTAVWPSPSSQLAHDVVDAAISKPLNAIVMVSTAPDNALYLYDLVTRVESKLALGKTPTSLSIAPDGLTAAIGHDALITHVDIAAWHQGSAPSATLLNVSAPVYGLVLDGHGKVYVFPAADQWVDLHVVDVATNTEQNQSTSLYAKTHAKLNPTGDAMYMLDTLVTPENLRKYSVAGSGAQYLYESPYWGDYSMCGNLWFSEDGNTIFTACGNTFHASSTQSSDMLYSGKLPLTDAGGYYAPSITSLSDSSSLGQIALLDAGKCGTAGGIDCDTVLRVYESTFFNPTAAFWLGPVPAEGRYRPNHGMFVFHASNGDKWIISRLVGVTDATHQSFLARMSATNATLN